MGRIQSFASDFSNLLLVRFHQRTTRVSDSTRVAFFSDSDSTRVTFLKMTRLEFCSYDSSHFQIILNQEASKLAYCL